MNIQSATFESLEWWDGAYKRKYKVCMKKKHGKENFIIVDFFYDQVVFLQELRGIFEAESQKISTSNKQKNCVNELYNKEKNFQKKIRFIKNFSILAEVENKIGRRCWKITVLSEDWVLIAFQFLINPFQLMYKNFGCEHLFVTIWYYLD